MNEECWRFFYINGSPSLFLGKFIPCFFLLVQARQFSCAGFERDWTLLVHQNPPSIVPKLAKLVPSTIMSLHEKAKDGTLDRQDLYQQPKGYDIDEQDSNGYTPMAYAVEGGHLNVIRTLKLNGASLTRKTADRRTLLHLAVASKQYSVAVVTYLLENGVNVDEPAGFPPNDTPLMTALRHNADTEVIEALKGAGASLTEKNSNGESAQDIADQLNNNRTKEAILPKEQQGQCRPELTNFIVSAILLAYAYLKIWGFLKDVIIAAIKQLYNEIVKPDRRKPVRGIGVKPFGVQSLTLRTHVGN